MTNVASMITVGSKKYHVHNSLLQTKIPTLFSYLQDRLSKTQACRVDGFREDTFEQIVLWLYQGHLQVPAAYGLIGYTDVYRFARQFDCETLQNLVMDATRKYSRDFQISRYVLQNYAGMLSKHIGGKMSKFLIDQLACEMVFSLEGYESAGSIEDFKAFFEADPETAVSLTFTLRRFQERKFEGITTRPFECFACVYHEHSKTPSCVSVLSKKALTDAATATSHSNLKLEQTQLNKSPSNSPKQAVKVRIPYPSPSTNFVNKPRHSLSAPSRPANVSTSSQIGTTQRKRKNEFDDSENTYTSNW